MKLFGYEMFDLKQAFDFFLRALVGGLHTVYSKCKKMNIHPIVCNTDQVRIFSTAPATTNIKKY